MKDRGEEAETFDRLIGRMAQGETDAVRAFFDRYGRLLYAAALSFTHSPPLAEEAVDGVLVRLWRDAGRIPKIRRPLSWLYTIARNQAKNVLRGERKAAPLAESACEETGFARAGTDGACCSHGRTALLLSLLLVVVLAVILPLALCRQSERGGYIVEASAEEFYRELDLNAPDHYEEGDYKLLYDENGKLTGGSSSLSGPGGYQFISFREEPFDDPRFYGEGGGVYVTEAGVSVLYYNEVRDDVYYTLATGKVQSQKFGPQYIVVEDYSYEGFEAVFAWFEKQFIA